MRVAQHLDRCVAQVLRSMDGVPADAQALLRTTQNAKFGDYQANGVLPLAKRMGKNPRELGEKLAEQLRELEEFSEAEVAGPGFVNLRLSPAWYSGVLTRHLHDLRNDGVEQVQEAKTIVVDFSSPNIAKQMHVGHLRSTIIGDALVRILKAVGHKVLGDNHLGDWGTQFGLLIVGMRSWGSREALDQEPVRELERVYTKASAQAKEDPAFAERARRELKKLQDGDAENRKEWETFVRATRKHLDAVYEKLDVSFDLWLGESTYHPSLPQVVSQLLASKIARLDDGAACVFFAELEGAPEDLKKHETPFIIQKKDGAFLYSTTDLATAYYRVQELKADQSIYVVDSRQALHFKQLFAILELQHVKLAAEHVGFGTVLGKDGKPLRTRDGGVVALADLLQEAETRAQARMQEQGLDLGDADRDRIATAVGVGAVKYADLKQNRMSDYRFDWDKMVSFQGNAGPYLQYAYARICAVFRKGNIDVGKLDKEGVVSCHTAEEASLARELLKFPDVVDQAATSREPHIICDHLYALAREFSSFYESSPILKAEPKTAQRRLALSRLCARQLARGLGLLGIRAIEKM